MANGIGRRIAFYLERTGMTQKELAQKAGITEAAVSRYISGIREPRAITVAAMARAMDISVNNLMGTESTPLEEAYEVVARNASDFSEEKRKELIRLLLDA